MMAKRLGKATRDRLAKLARERTPVAGAAELEKIEAGYVEESAFRKQQAEVNLPRWAAIRKARGASK